MVSSSQTLASTVGHNLLMKGANCVAASIAVAAVLAVVEPCSTGLGGDAFALVHDEASRKVEAVNGSGKSSFLTPSLEDVKAKAGYDKAGGGGWQNKFHPLTVTVPGAAHMWHSMYLRYCQGEGLKKFGGEYFTFLDILQPAIDLAENGFPVPGPVTSSAWAAGVNGQIASWKGQGMYEGGLPFTSDGTNPPKEGEIFRNPELAEVMRDLGSSGSDGFYLGSAGKSICETVRKLGGVLTMEDLAGHSTDFLEPISVTYGDKKLWEIGPNSQGMAALIALESLNRVEQTKAPTSEVEELHAMVECMRLGFEDARSHIADSSFMKVEPTALLSKERLHSRVDKVYDRGKAVAHTQRGASLGGSCTVSFQCVDKIGNAVSFVNSNYMGFGTGIVPPDCGFSLQNRGAGFSLEPGQANTIAPSKRPFHTIIPALATNARDGTLYATFSNMGGWMQPQGHLQLFHSLVKKGMSPQDAIDRSRFCIASGERAGELFLEQGFSPGVVDGIRSLGHSVREGAVEGFERSLFGRAQIIVRKDDGTLVGGSDGRADGCCIGL